MHIYMIKNKVNGKVYVGQTVQRLERRWALHKHHSHTKNRPLYRAMRKYGVHNFEMVLLETILEYPDLEALNALEQFWIDKLNSMAPNGYNLTSGGNGKYHLSDETKARISSSNKGRKHSAATKAKLSDAQTGKPSPRKGAVLSDATKAKISQVQMGKVLSEETKAKQSKANSGSNNVLSKKVRCIETGEVFDSTGDAARKLGLIQSSISAVCIKKRKKTGGFTFEYLTPTIKVGDNNG